MHEALTFQENATRIIRVLMQTREIRSVDELGSQTGIPKQRLYDRMSGRAEWTIDDLEELCRFFGMRTTAFAYKVTAIFRLWGPCPDCGIDHN